MTTRRPPAGGRTGPVAVALLLLVAATPALPAAAGSSAPQPSGPGATAAPQIRIERAVAVGETLEIRLDANATTGFSWIVDDTASDGLDKLSAAGGHYEAAPQEDAASGGVPPVGAGGVQVFLFRGAAPGRARVVFGYQRAWMPNVFEKTAEAIVTVK